MAFYVTVPRQPTISGVRVVTNRPVAVLITASTPWPLSARLAVRMIAHGCAVSALCPRGHILNQVSRMQRIYRYGGPNSLAGLERAIRQAKPDMMVPSDDRAVWQLHELHAKRPDLRELIETSIGRPESFAAVSSRTGLMDIARRAGLRVPETRLIHAESDIHAWFGELSGAAVMKMDGTWGGRGVAFVESAAEAVTSWSRFNAPEPRGTPVKRWLVNRDPLAFWSGARASGRAISLQKFVRGGLANAMVACWRGTVLGVVSVEVLCTQGRAGASTIVRLVQNEEIAQAARALVHALGLSGFCGLDFVLEEGTGAAYLIELNARCTQLGHLVLPGQGDLAGLLCAQLGAPGVSEAESPIDREVIAFFPQSLAWNPDSPYMQQCHHDVPWSEPLLVRELLQVPWAERRWLFRLYHRLRGRRPSPLPTAGTGAFRKLAAQHGLSSDLVES